MGRKPRRPPRSGAPSPSARKEPAYRPEIRTRKSPAYSGRFGGYLKQSPCWRLSAIDVDGPFGWRRLSSAEGERIWRRLAAYERLTWDEILGHHNHRNSVGGFSRAARDRLRELNLDDYEELVSLRVTGRNRIYGFLDENAYHILWWDPDHQVYPSQK